MPTLFVSIVTAAVSAMALPHAMFAPVSDYITRFAAKDPFPELLMCHEGTWMRLSEHLSVRELRRNEWYNDFVLKCGVGDIIAAQITNTGSHTAVFGIHEGIGEKPICTSEQEHLNQFRRRGSRV